MEHAENLSADAAQEAQADSAPGRAMRVAAALQAKGGEEFAKPGSIVEIKFVKGQSLSLTASRLLALMILTAGGDAWQDRPHRMRKADIRRGHKGNERISDMLEELHRTRSEEHTSELQSLMRISYAVFCLKKKKTQIHYKYNIHQIH